MSKDRAGYVHPEPPDYFYFDGKRYHVDEVVQALGRRTIRFHTVHEENWQRLKGAAGEKAIFTSKARQYNVTIVGVNTAYSTDPKAVEGSIAVVEFAFDSN